MKTEAAILAWHFVGDTLRDGRPIPADGEVLRHDGWMRMCASGLHASLRLIDALQYAPGGTLCRVECAGDIEMDGDKLVCRERTILWRIDAEPMLRAFARWCALRVIHLWDAPDVVIRYLRTGDESIRAAAWRAAWDVARDAAWDAARGAAGDAATHAAWVAAWASARDATLAAALAAEREAQAMKLARMVEEARAGQTHWVWPDPREESGR